MQNNEARETKQATADELLGRTISPRSVPHGYQVRQWENHESVFSRLSETHPTLDRDSFMAGWNAAFSEIYGG